MTGVGLIGVGLIGRGPARAADPEPGSGIVGGEAAEVCALPTVVAIEETGCSGVLVGSTIVLTAAHCTQSLEQPRVRFGERSEAPARVVETLACVANPSWTGLVDASDYGYCRLAEPVELPPLPVARGCEREAVAPGVTVVLAGFGEDEQGEAGRKRWVEGALEQLEQTDAGELLTLGGEGEDSCFGDSGGPVLLRLGADEGWRVIGLIIGGAEACGDGGLALAAGPALGFAERDSGLDLDPCRDAAGDWAPTAACGGFALAPLQTGGSWAEGCADAPLSGRSASCGPASEEEREGDGCGCTSGTGSKDGLGLVWVMVVLLGGRRAQVRRSSGLLWGATRVSTMRANEGNASRMQSRT